MFSGIVEAMGKVVALERGEDGARISLRVPAPLDDLPPSTSLCVSGTCLTVVDGADGVLVFDAVGATLQRTRLGDLARGDRVNLERSLRLGGAIDGHLVTGHVDGMGTVTDRTEGEGAVFFEIQVPAELAGQIAPRGSVAVDGVSLTIAESRGDRFRVSIVPYTLRETTLGDLRPGHVVHLETDVLAKYVERVLIARGTSALPAGTLPTETDR